VENLDQLEAKIEQLLENHERVKKEKNLINDQLEHKESESHQLKGQLRQYERERIEIREKLGKILGQLEQLDLS